MPELFPQQDVYDLNVRSEVRRWIPPDVKRVIDISCGKGGFALTLREALGADAHLTGLEPVSPQAEVACRQPFDEVIEGFFPEAVADRLGEFDLVCFNDVLEHFADPWTMLTQTRPLLSPHGRVLAAIPNIQYWPAVVDLVNGKWEYTESGLMDVTHLRFFTRASIIALFERAGFEVLTCEGANSVWGAEWAPHRIGNRVKRKLAGIVRGLIARLRPDGQFLHFIVVARPRHEPSTA